MQGSAKIGSKNSKSHSQKTRPVGFLTKAAKRCYFTSIPAAFIFFSLEILALKITPAGAVPDLELTLQDSKYTEPTNFRLK